MANVLIPLIIILAIVALVQITRVSELLGELKKIDVNNVTEEDNNTQGFLFVVIGGAFLIFVVWQMLEWNHLLLPPASSMHGEQIDALMQFTMG